MALHQQGRLPEARALYDEILASFPLHPDSLHLLGLLTYQEGDLQEALELIGRAIAINADNPAVFNNRGIVLHAQRAHDEAVTSYDRAISLYPGYSEAWNNRGIALHALGEYDGAVASYNRAIALRPDYIEAWNNLGIARHALKQYDVAVEHYNRAIALCPDYSEAWNNRAISLQAMMLLGEAVKSYQQAIALNANYAEACSNLGIAFQGQKELELAVESYDRAIALKPDYAEALWNKSYALLMGGNYAEGFELFEWRWLNEKSGLKQRSFPQPLWLGKESLEGKTILLHSEQGYGDTLQFCRYARLVRELGARVILEADLPLLGLLETLSGPSLLLPKGRVLPGFDCHCPLMSLPLAFRTEVTSIPAFSAYLSSDAEKRAHWSKVLGKQEKPRVGLVWCGNPYHLNDPHRSIPLADLLKHLPSGVQYVSLQKEVRDIEKPLLHDNEELVHFGDELRDFADTAALADLMDLVISVDTSVAHLCGALGKRTWVLLPFCPDWRWQLDRTDSPWYPSATLYRQPAPSEWERVLKAVGFELERTLGLAG